MTFYDGTNDPTIRQCRVCGEVNDPPARTQCRHCKASKPTVQAYKMAPKGNRLHICTSDTETSGLCGRRTPVLVTHPSVICSLTFCRACLQVLHEIDTEDEDEEDY